MLHTTAVRRSTSYIAMSRQIAPRSLPLVRAAVGRDAPGAADGAAAGTVRRHPGRDRHRGGRSRTGGARRGGGGRGDRPARRAAALGRRRSSRSTRPGRATSTRRCTSSAAAAASASRYAIADLAAFVTPGGALDAAVWARGVTIYAPDRADAAAPARAVGGRGEPAARTRSGRPCCGRSTSTRTGRRPRSTCARAVVRSRARLDYAGVQAQLDAGRRRTSLVAAAPRSAGCARRSSAPAAASRLPLPEQEVVPRPGGGVAVATGRRCPSRASTPRSRC